MSAQLGVCWGMPPAWRESSQRYTSKTVLNNASETKLKIWHAFLVTATKIGKYSYWQRTPNATVWRWSRAVAIVLCQAATSASTSISAPKAWTAHVHKLSISFKVDDTFNQPNPEKRTIRNKQTVHLRANETPGPFSIEMEKTIAKWRRQRMGMLQYRCVV